MCILLQLDFPNKKSLFMEVSKDSDHDINYIYLSNGSNMEAPNIFLKRPAMVKEDIQIHLLPNELSESVRIIKNDEIFFFTPNSDSDWVLIFKSLDDEEPIGYLRKTELIYFDKFPKDKKKEVAKLLSLSPNASTSFGLFEDTQCEISFTDTLSLQTIDTIPDEIDGGMCQLFLSEYDKKVNSPFCITDMGDVLFIYVDGELNKLRQDSLFSSRLFQYRNDKYLMKIYIHEGETEDEQCDIKGFCKINSLNSLRVYEHSFIGKCIW